MGGARTTSTCQLRASFVHRRSGLGGYPAQCLQSELAALNNNSGLWDQGWLARIRCRKGIWERTAEGTASVLLGTVFMAPPHLVLASGAICLAMLFIHPLKAWLCSEPASHLQLRHSHLGSQTGGHKDTAPQGSPQLSCAPALQNSTSLYSGKTKVRCGPQTWRVINPLHMSHG